MCAIYFSFGLGYSFFGLRYSFLVGSEHLVTLILGWTVESRLKKQNSQKPIQALLEQSQQLWNLVLKHD